MKAKPSIQRARVLTELLLRSPRGMTEPEIRRLLAAAIPDADGVRELLGGMVASGTIARVESPRPGPAGPKVTYLASSRVRARRKPPKGQGTEGDPRAKPDEPTGGPPR